MKKPIYERIIAEAEKERTVLLSTAEQEAKALIEAGKAALKRQSAEELQSAKDTNNARVQAFAERQEKSLTTFQEQARQQLVVTVFNDVCTKLGRLEGSDLLHFVTRLIKEEDVRGNEVMYVAKRNYQKYAAALGKNLEHLNKTDPRFHFTLSSESTHIAEGFLLAGEAFDLMFDFSEIVTEYQKANEQRIYNELFNDEK